MSQSSFSLFLLYHGRNLNTINKSLSIRFDIVDALMVFKNQIY